MDNKMGRQAQARPSGPSRNDQATLWALIEKTTLAHASDLARSGRYAEAETVIQDAIRDRDASPAILDLLARIHAQQRHWKEADAAWSQARHLDPQNEEYVAGLKRILKMKHWRIFPRILLLIIMSLLIVLVCLAGGRFLIFPSHPSATITFTEILTPSLTQTPSPTQTASPTPSQTLAQTPSPSLTQILSPTPAPITCKVITGILNGSLNVRSGPDVNFPAIGALLEGEQVVILGNPDIHAITGWIFIIREPDLKGWVNSSYCK